MKAHSSYVGRLTAAFSTVLKNMIDVSVSTSWLVLLNLPSPGTPYVEQNVFLEKLLFMVINSSFDNNRTIKITAVNLRISPLL